MASVIVTVFNISALKAYPVVTANNTTAIVQGYETAGDGGGGTFIFKTLSSMSPSLPPTPDDGIFFGSSTNPLGIWIRQFDGDVSVRFYNASGNGQNDTIKIQAAIEYVAASVEDVNNRKFGFNITNTVFIPNGSYMINQLILKKGVKLIGASRQNVTLFSNPYNAVNSAMIVMAQGIVRDLHVANITFLGAAERVITENGSSYEVYKRYQSCFYLQGIPDPISGAGGLWESSFKNIYIGKFSGHSMIFEGGGHSGTTNYLLPNQFITFEGVHIDSVGQLQKIYPNFVNQYQALAIVGLNAQFAFFNCRFDGGEFLFQNDLPRYELTGRNIYIGSRIANELGTPAVINFHTCTIQGGDNGFFIESSTNINIYGCWFENLQRAIVVRGTYKTSASINIQNNIFGRSAGRFKNTGTGRNISIDKSQVNVQNNYVADNYSSNHPQYPLVTPQFIGIENQANNIGINAFGNYFENHELAFTSGLVKLITLIATSNETVDILNCKTINIDNGTGTTKNINKILSNSAAGEYIYFKVTLGQIKFVNSGNLFLNGLDNLILGLNDSALFIKVDGPSTTTEIYNLISYQI